MGKGPGTINGKLNPRTNRYEVKYKKDKGGLSYGTWQIETAKDGTMNDYLDYLDHNGYNSIYQRLQRAGGFNAAREGIREFVETWQQIAEEEPELFRRSQYEFIRKNNYEKRSLKSLNRQNPNFNLDSHHPVIKDILWSIGVQHSPAGVDEIIRNTFIDKKDLTDEEFIHRIYKKRTEYIENYPKNKPIELNPNGPIHKRYIEEMNEALKRLKQ